MQSILYRLLRIFVLLGKFKSVMSIDSILLAKVGYHLAFKVLDTIKVRI